MLSCQIDRKHYYTQLGPSFPPPPGGVNIQLTLERQQFQILCDLSGEVVISDGNVLRLQLQIKSNQNTQHIPLNKHIIYDDCT